MNFFSKFDGSAEFDHVGLSPRTNSHVESVTTKAPADAIVVKDADLLFNGDFKRSGSDLVISHDHRELVLADYFKGEKRPLASADGAHLSGKVVEALTGHVQVAQADGSASAAKIIGQVTKLSGTATAIRNGVSIILNQGDTVYQGDVVQSGSNSTLGITFIDGSVFGLGPSAKMVLNEMIFDPNGSNNSTLLSLVQGTISFVAGATAKHGDMKVDTPVATMGIRGTAVLVEIDFEVLPTLPSAPPARFQVLVEPDGTSGSYVLLDKVTLSPIATVNQPGTTTTVSGQGTVTFLPTATLSLDAQRIISEVFTMKFTDNTNSKTNFAFTDTIIPFSTSPFKLPSGEEITVALSLFNIQSSAAAQVQTTGNKIEHIHQAPAVSTSDVGFVERAGIKGSSLADTIVGTIGYADVNVGNVPSASAAFDHYVYQNRAGNDVTGSLTAEQLAAISKVIVPLGIEQDPNGKNIGTAHYTYSAADKDFDFLAAGESLVLTYVAKVESNFPQDNLVTFQSFTITITGTNDAPVVTTTNAEFTEHSGTKPPLIDKTSGTITFADVDLTDRPVTSVSFTAFTLTDSDGDDITATLTPQQLAAIAAVEAKLTLTPSPGNAQVGTVDWSYEVADDKFGFLTDGEILTLTYTATVDDGNGGVVKVPFTITIHGTGTAFLVNEIEGRTGDAESIDTAAGIVPFKNVDLSNIADVTSQLVSTTLSSGNALPAGLADQLADSFFASDTHSGSVQFNFGTTDNTFDFLADGETLSIDYSVTVTNAAGVTSTQTITILVIGSNDAPTITAATTPASTTGGVVEDGTQTATGTITFQDVDLIDTHVVTKALTGGSANLPLPGFDPTTQQLGTLTLQLNENATDADNIATVDWAFTINNALAQQLAAGQVITQTYTVSIDDQHGGVITQLVTVTITGADDAPTITAATTPASTSGAVVEDGKQTASGTITFQDVDLIDTHLIGKTLTAGSANLALPGFNPATEQLGALTLKLNESATDTDNVATVDWTFTIDNALAQQLAVGQVITQTYTVSIDDQHGGVITQPVTVTITGAEDAPTITAATTPASTSGGVVEDGKQTATGTITFQDVDLIDTHIITQALAGGSANLALPGFNPATQQLGSLTLKLNESAIDTDNIATVDWTFTIDNALAQQLAAGQVITQTYIVTIDDQHGGVITQPVTVTITGTEDTPTITTATTPASTSGAVVEDGKQTAGGTITFQDVDLIDTHLIGNTLTGGSANLTLPGFNPATQPLGTLTLQLNESAIDTDNIATVDWTFTLDNALAQQLAVGQVITQTYTVSIDDQHGGVITQPVTVTITGTNDAPTITAATTPASTSGGVVEDGKQTATGTITFQDLDLIDTHLIGNTLTAGSANLALPGFNPATQQLGALTLKLNESVIDTDNIGTVDWTFTIDNALAQQLAVGQVITQTYTVSIDDQHGGVISQPVTVTITGTNDAPTITAATTPASTSGGVVEDGKQTASGTITFQDVDLIDTHLIDNTLTGGSANLTLPGFNPATQPLGTLTLQLNESAIDTDNTGTVDWTFTIDNALAQQLAVGQVITQTYTISIDDQHGGVITQPVTVTITGAEDAPTITAATTPASTSGGVVEDGKQSAGGTITFQDVDLVDTHLIGQTLTGGSANLTLPGFNPATQPLGTLTLQLNESAIDTDNIGTVDWTFTVDNALAQQLAAGQVITQTYTVSIDDHHGGVITQPVTVTISGTNDAPTITAAATSGKVAEDIDVDPTTGQIASSGSIDFSDLDLIDVHSASVTLLHSSTNSQLAGFVEDVTNIGTLSVSVNETTTDTINTGSVDWTFSLDDNDAMLQALDEGETITQTYLVSISDGKGGTVDQEVTITIYGTHDGPLISVAPVSGVEGSPIHLDLTLNVPQSSLSSLVVGAIPVGATLDDGHGHTFTASAGSTSVDVADWSLSDLSITSTNDLNFELTYLASANSGQSTNVDEPVTVLPLPPEISWSKDTFSEKSNQNIALPNLTVAVDALPGDQNSLYSVVLLGIPAGMVITDGGGHDHISTGPGDTYNYATWNLDNFHLDSEGQTATFTITAVATTVDAEGNLSTSSSALLLAVVDPAGIAGSDINLGLAATAPESGTLVTVTVNDLPSGWTLAGAIQVDAHTWMVQTTDVQSLSVTTSSATLGAVVLEIHESWTAADGSTVSALVFDNVETFAPGSPIFALAVNDYLTGSAGADQFVFAQPIAHDVIYDFDVAHDVIDLIGFSGFSDFGDVAAHLSGDGFGNAVLTLASGATITLHGVSADSLVAANFQFDQQPVLTNTSEMVIGDSARLPIGGLIENSGTIELGSTGNETDLSIIQTGATLSGGGTILLSDSDANVISATGPNATLNNVDNTISGAGQLGDGDLILVNSGTINATGVHSLVIDTGSEAVLNTGTLEASGIGGMVVASDVTNLGILWANQSTLTVLGAVDGSGSAIIDGGGKLDLEGHATVDVVFGADGAGTLILGDSFHFAGTIAGFGANDSIELKDFRSADTTIDYHENDAGTGGTLVISDGMQTAELELVGHYAADDFSVVNDPIVGAHIAYLQHALVG